eukprot:4998072-Prymnesium_polylepis.1
MSRRPHHAPIIPDPHHARTTRARPDAPEPHAQRPTRRAGKTSGRTDDNIESIKKRFHTYVNETQARAHSNRGTGGAVWQCRRCCWLRTPRLRCVRGAAPAAAATAHRRWSPPSRGR